MVRPETFWTLLRKANRQQRLPEVIVITIYKTLKHEEKRKKEERRNKKETEGEKINAVGNTTFFASKTKI